VRARRMRDIAVRRVLSIHGRREESALGDRNARHDAARVVRFRAVERRGPRNCGISCAVVVR
jgi:hypothetical protein